MSDLNAYHDIFAEESREFLAILDDGLLALEASPGDGAAVDAAYRGAHSLKGMCAAMGYQSSSELAASMERLIGLVRSGDLDVTAPLLVALQDAAVVLDRLISADIAGTGAVEGDAPDLDPVTFGARSIEAKVRDRSRLVRVDVTLDDSCTLKAVRAHVVIKRAALLGEVTGSEPTPTCLQEQRFDRSFSVTVRTDRSIEEIVSAVGGIVEVAGVSAEQLVVCEDEADLPAFSEMQIDALGEVGNIGAGHAATALSEMLGKRIALSQPALQIVPAGEVPYAFGISRALVGAVYSQLAGSVGGGILTVATQEALLVLADLASGKEVGSTRSLGDVEEGLFLGVGSALAEAYVGAVSLMTGLDMTLSEPAFEIDHAGAILERVARDVASDAPWAALVRTTLTAENQSIDVAIIFVPDQSGIAILFERLGLG